MSKWKVDIIERGKENNPIVQVFCEQIISDGDTCWRFICMCQNTEDAEQIVREHNSHEELVASVELLMKPYSINTSQKRNIESLLRKEKGNE